MMPAGRKLEPLDDRWMSIPKAAAELGLSRQGVLVRVAKREIESEFVADRVVVSRASVAQLKEQLEEQRAARAGALVASD